MSKPWGTVIDVAETDSLVKPEVCNPSVRCLVPPNDTQVRWCGKLGHLVGILTILTLVIFCLVAMPATSSHNVLATATHSSNTSAASAGRIGGLTGFIQSVFSSLDRLDLFGHQQTSPDPLARSSYAPRNESDRPSVKLVIFECFFSFFWTKFGGDSATGRFVAVPIFDEVIGSIPVGCISISWGMDLQSPNLALPQVFQNICLSSRSKSI